MFADVRHPLQRRCSESAKKFWRQADELGFAKSDDKDFGNFVFEFQTTGTKLAGALNGIAEDRGSADAAFTVACLKRALDHRHKSQAGLEAVGLRQLTSSPTFIGAGYFASDRGAGRPAAAPRP